ncbi:hypothetical protein PV416_05310 [Streptomyces ipomoeae]|jgi:hypothetical protein|uniref:hypothetical protein n=1 Tax=Streptomyces ipomoeae TaxID=103232 RepID=UPI001319BDA6|nr:hypothetical protein [Streptomyces ipomoeae]MDX2695511.1 hypothetical protein [Streptomyces ipomoeae]MDX2820519.1 hypothetical protein [Streptomyces ipomoeae]MDX2844417.1 hypothetical protein [Streptomyces ipomoeae]MDX2875914.1 hypothetical protein [Streptomyces ipomoeae]
MKRTFLCRCALPAVLAIASLTLVNTGEASAAPAQKKCSKWVKIPAASSEPVPLKAKTCLVRQKDGAGYKIRVATGVYYYGKESNPWSIYTEQYFKGKKISSWHLWVSSKDRVDWYPTDWVQGARDNGKPGLRVARSYVDPASDRDKPINVSVQLNVKK